MGAVAAVAFREALVAAARPAFAALDDAAVAAALAPLIMAGSEQWPEIPLELSRFGGELARRLDADATPQLLGELHHDIWLAIACGLGDARALAHADALVATEVAIATSRLRARPSQSEELHEEVRRIVFVDDERRAAAIRRFTGTGDLRGYARIIAARALVRILQRDRREVPVDADALELMGPDLVSAFAPPIALLRERHRSDLDAALRTALADLADRPRALLRYHLIDGWTIDRIGERYGVHRATAARWLADAREQVGKLIRKELARRLAIPKSDVDSLVMMLTSGIDVSLERLLAGPSKP